MSLIHRNPLEKTVRNAFGTAGRVKIEPAPFRSTDATPFDLFSIALNPDTMITIEAVVSCRSATTSLVAEFRARGMASRTSGGTSSRAGGANGIQDSVGNTFAVPRPNVTFGDPSATNIFTVIGTAGRS